MGEWQWPTFVKSKNIKACGSQKWGQHSRAPAPCSNARRQAHPERDGCRCGAEGGLWAGRSRRRRSRNQVSGRLSPALLGLSAARLDRWQEHHRADSASQQHSSPRLGGLPVWVLKRTETVLENNFIVMIKLCLSDNKNWYWRPRRWKCCISEHSYLMAHYGVLVWNSRATYLKGMQKPCKNHQQPSWHWEKPANML